MELATALKNEGYSLVQKRLVKPTSVFCGYQISHPVRRNVWKDNLTFRISWATKYEIFEKRKH
jgi:hypothetical protein